MLNIQDRLFVSLKIDGQEVEYANLISIIAAEGNGTLVPAIKITISDPTSAFSSDKTFTDGNEIEITFAKSYTDNQVSPRRYRVFSPHRGNQAFNPVVEIVGILNAPDYITKSARESYKGTSESVLKQVASKCGLRFTGPSSIDGRAPNDSQTWLNVCSNRAKFMMEVTRHGWIDDHSGLSSAVTSYGELRYRDLIALINTPIDRVQFVFSHNSLPSSSDDKKKSYIVKEARDRSSAGVMSAWQNYGSTRAQNMLEGEHEISKELQVKMPGNYLPINKSVADQVDRSRIEYAPLDCGNVHKKYEIAKYQNIKLNALFSEKMSLLVDVVTEVELYDVVVYRQEDADLRQPVKNTDIYIVVGKTLVVSGGAFYAERIELARMSLTMKGTAELETPSGASSERSMIPDVSIVPSNRGVAAAANRANVGSLGSLVQKVSTGNAVLDGVKQTLLAPLTGVMGNIGGAVDKILNGNMDVSTVRGLLGSVRTVASSVATLKSAVTYVTAANGGLLSALTSQADAVKYQLISQANGVTTSLVNQYAIAMPLQAVTGAMTDILGATPKDLLASVDEYKAIHNELTGAAYDIAGITGNVNGQWNQALSVLRKADVPSSYGSGIPQIGVNIQQGLRVPSMTDANILGIVHEGLRKDYNGQPGWMNPAGMPTYVQSLTSNPVDKMKASYAAASDFTNRLVSNV